MWYVLHDRKVYNFHQQDTNALVQGTGDNFYKQGQLLPENFEAAVKEAGIEGVTLRYQEVNLKALYSHAQF